MSRYIDADKVMEEINRIGGHNLCEWDTLGVKALICKQDTLDVVPREEVERIKRGIFEEIERLFDPSTTALISSKYNLSKELDELKKKYAEET